MQHLSQQRIIRGVCRIYGALLFAYPPDFRRRYGGEMTQVFRDRCRALERTPGVCGVGVVRFIIHILVDWFTTSVLEMVTYMKAAAVASTVRLALLLGIMLNLAMIGVRVFFYRPLLVMPGGLKFVIEPALLLIVYALLVVWATSRADPLRQRMLQIGTPLGLLGGMVQIVHMLLENLVNFGAVNGTVTLSSMLLTFLLWGVAGYRASRTTTSTGLGALTGSWSALVTMLMAVTFGFALLYSSIPRLDYVATWPEFQRSGWRDVHAFSIANTLDSGFSHLLIGPIVGVLFGGVAGIIARFQHKPQPSAA